MARFEACSVHTKWLESMAESRIKNMNLDPVVAMFVISANFCCTTARKKYRWFFAASCAQYGDNDAMKAQYPFNGTSLNVTGERTASDMPE
jgi:hypothetical protein